MAAGRPAHGLWPRHCQARGGGSPHERERQLLRARNQDGHLADPQGHQVKGADERRVD
jgi:hypothetical protein